MKKIVLVSSLCAGLLTLWGCNPTTGGDGRNASVTEGGQNKSAQQGKRVALVIGNSDYSTINKLGDNPRNDAEDIAAALRDFGFEVTLLKDAKRRDFKEALEKFGRSIGDSSAALFYFAGHGIQIKGENFLMPIDASVETEAAVKDEAVNLNRVLEEMEGGNHANIVLIDACRDNPITGRFRTAGRGLALPTSTPDGTAIAFASAPGKVAANSGTNGRNGLFTAGLLTAFKGQDLSLGGVLTVASEVVENASDKKQTPYVHAPKTLEKNFHFRVTVTPSVAATEMKFWESIQNSNDAEDFKEYLKKYPNGEYAGLARNRINRLQTPTTPAPQASPAPVSVAPTPTTEIIDKRYQILANGAEVKDLQTNLIWQRCQVGMKWNGNTCTGEAKEFTFENAKKQAGNGWRMPTIRELSSLIYCSSGKMKGSDNVGDGGAPIKNWCDGDYTKPTINTKAFPNTPASYVWSGSPDADDASGAWYVNFVNGYSVNLSRLNGNGVRLVRGGQ